MPAINAALCRWCSATANNLNGSDRRSKTLMRFIPLRYGFRNNRSQPFLQNNIAFIASA
jgi:hypothetical protein